MPRGRKKVVAEVQEVKEVKEQVEAPKVKISPETVVKCSHCGSLTFYNEGKCKWCYKDLEVK
jgi:hypothetical protein